MLSSLYSKIASAALYFKYRFGDTRKDVNLGHENNLVFLRFLASDMFRPTYVRTFMKLSVAMMCVLFVCHASLFFWVYTVDSRESINYVTLLSVIVYAANAQYFLLSYSTFVEDIETDGSSSCSRKCREIIRRQSKSAEFLALAVLILDLAVCTTFAIHGEHDSFMVLPVKFFEDRVPSGARAAHWIKGIILFPWFYTLALTSFQMQYLSHQVTSHMCFLIDSIKGMARLHHTKENGFGDSAYQTRIRQMLVAQSKHYGKILGFVRKKNAEIGAWMLVFSSLGALIGVGIVLTTFKGKLSYKKLRLSIGYVLFVLIFSSLISSGQAVETESERIIQALLMTKWYKWNNENRKIMLMLLTNIKPIRLQYFRSFQFNYTLGVSIVRTIYSFGSLLINISR